MCYFLCYSSSYGFNVYIVRCVFVCDHSSWLFFYMYWLDHSIYVFEKDIALPMVVCHAHGRVKSLEYIPKTPLQPLRCGYILNILNSRKYICVPLFVALTMCFFAFFDLWLSQSNMFIYSFRSTSVLFFVFLDTVSALLARHKSNLSNLAKWFFLNMFYLVALSYVGLSST